MSGFAGVYFELLLKSSKASVWVKNIQFAIYGILISGASIYVFDEGVQTRGFFAGYNKF